MKKNVFFTILLFLLLAKGNVVFAEKNKLNSIESFTIESSDVYNNSIELTQVTSTEVEIKRLRQVQKKFDHIVTGFYLPAGKTLKLNVEILTPSSDNRMPALVIGTRIKDGSNVKEIPLQLGLNTISSSQHSGGIIYLRYITNGNNPTGKARVTFAQTGSQHVKHPYYVLGTSTIDEFKQQLTNYGYTDVVFANRNAIIVVNKANVEKYSLTNYNNKPHNIDEWLKSVERIFDAQRDISGVSSDDPNSLHKPMNTSHRNLMVEANSGYMFATDYGSGYNGSNDGAMQRLLTQYQIENNPWGISHELGHQNQQSAYKPGEYTETTVNFYSMAVMRSFFGANWQKWDQSVWDKVHNNWFPQPDANRNYWGNEIGNVYKNVNESRLIFLAQLQYIFGDELTKLLHRITREEKKDGSSNDERKFYFLYKIMEISGYDLRDLYYKWGLFIPAYYQEKIDKLVSDKQLPKPPYNDNLYLTTPFSSPDPGMTYPLPLIGIKSSSPASADVQPGNQLASKLKYCNYDSKNGEVTDVRDGKKYAYKRYGNTDWFMENLNWNGYDGNNAATNNTVGVAVPGDSEGKVYGRYYPTNAFNASKSWCPSGWDVANTQDWKNLFTSIKQEYNTTDEQLAPMMKCGEDRDRVSDGLWAKGPMTIQNANANTVGFNALPAGVYNNDQQSYDGGDQMGMKASFIDESSTWYHNFSTAESNIWENGNKNSRHYASIRCVRPTQSGTAKLISANEEAEVYPNPAKDVINIKLPAKQNGTVKIYNTWGNIVKSMKTNLNSRTISFDVSTLLQGTYFIHIESETGTTISKFIKN
ncbi:M60 family metallopeptidase [Chryseobacterium sp. Chry.R1]|uniref:M60 family metallopeptidase n=1 Tax=Chryseobacterium sp. Chry.R1 TaxID=3139392 RepID=UPI0031F96FCE